MGPVVLAVNAAEETVEKCPLRLTQRPLWSPSATGSTIYTSFVNNVDIVDTKIRSPASAETDEFYCPDALVSPRPQATGSKNHQFLYWKDFLILFHHFS